MNLRVLVAFTDVGREVGAVATGVLFATHQWVFTLGALAATCIAAFLHSWLKPYWKTDG